MAFQYLGLRARLEHVDVTEEEVNRQLVRLQQQSKRRTPVFDRPSQNGDELVLDYAGFADGKQFAGGTAEKRVGARRGHKDRVDAERGCRAEDRPDVGRVTDILEHRHTACTQTVQQLGRAW